MASFINTLLIIMTVCQMLLYLPTPTLAIMVHTTGLKDT